MWYTRTDVVFIFDLDSNLNQPMRITLNSGQSFLLQFPLLIYFNPIQDCLGHGKFRRVSKLFSTLSFPKELPKFPNILDLC